MEVEKLQEVLKLHKLWLENKENGQRANLSGANLYGANLFRANLSHAYLFGADLSGANLFGAYLFGAYLSGANLSDANLSNANLSGADLSRADLSRADLSGAYLSGAYLSGAYLSRANLSGAYLSDETILPTQETWQKYYSEVVPSLLAAGGRTIKEIIGSGCWNCHEWQNCPMHIAFGIDSPEKGPALLVPRIKEFVQYFDARLLDKYCPVVV